jgi:pyruvate dehydrogenase E1 component alpha subunit
MNNPSDPLLSLFFQMQRIRKVQLKIEAHYLENEMKTPVHLYIGQEAIAVGVCAALSSQDYINSNHRSHGHYLAKGGNLKALLAELFCRETGCSKGRGGSMHLIDVSVGHMGSSSIVGGGIPLSVGMGLAIQMQKKPLVSVAFFSDGAADEGTLYESINFATLKKLPVVFLYENNHYSVCSPVTARQAGEIIFHRTPPELMFTAIVDGNDVEAVAAVARQAVDRARRGDGPSFIECKTYRIRGHAGCESQDAKGYRPTEEVDAWKARCPISRLQERLLTTGALTKETLAAMESRIDTEIAEAWDFARTSPFPADDTLHDYLLKEETHALVKN